MDLKKHISDYFSHIDGKNYQALEAQLDAKHSFTNSITPAPLGAKEHVGMIQNLTGALTGGHTIDVIVTDGHEWVSARGRYKGKHTGEFMGVAATGKSVEFSWIDMQRVVNGKIVEEYMELNPGAIMQQIGAAPVRA
ncbi:MAG: ester cyclase [Flavobacteriales bacterium]